MSEFHLRRVSIYLGVFPFNLLRTTAHRFIGTSSLKGIHPKDLNCLTEEVLGCAPRIIRAAPFCNLKILNSFSLLHEDHAYRTPVIKHGFYNGIVVNTLFRCQVWADMSHKTNFLVLFC